MWGVPQWHPQHCSSFSHGTSCKQMFVCCDSMGSRERDDIVWCGANRSVTIPMCQSLCDVHITCTSVKGPPVCVLCHCKFDRITFTERVVFRAFCV